MTHCLAPRRTRLLGPLTNSPPLSATSMPRALHSMHFYETMTPKTRDLVEFIRTGFANDELVVIISTKIQEEALLEALNQQPEAIETPDWIADKINRQQLRLVNAESLLPTLILPDKTLNEEVAKAAIAALVTYNFTRSSTDTTTSSTSPSPPDTIDGTSPPETTSPISTTTTAPADCACKIRLYGEMVSLCIAAGNFEACVTLERLWHEACQRMPSLTVMCGYSSDLLKLAESELLFLQGNEAGLRCAAALRDALSSPTADPSHLPSAQRTLVQLSRLHDQLCSSCHVPSHVPLSDAPTFSSPRAPVPSAPGDSSPVPSLSLNPEPTVLRSEVKELSTATDCLHKDGCVSSSSSADSKSEAVANGRESKPQLRIATESLSQAIAHPCLIRPVLEAVSSQLTDCASDEKTSNESMSSARSHSSSGCSPKSNEAASYLRTASRVMSLETQLVRMKSNETDFISNQELLSAAKTAAEHQAKSRTEFLCNISHELRTPLGAVLGYSELVTQQLNMCQTISDFAQSKSEMLEMIGVISHNGRELTRLVNSLLDFAKLERGSIAVERSEFSLQSLIADVANTMQLNAQQKHLFFHVHCGACSCNPSRSADAVPDRIVSDSMRIRQILVNLLGNAFKFTAQGGVNLGISFRSSVANSESASSSSSPPPSIHPPPAVTALPPPITSSNNPAPSAAPALGPSPPPAATPTPSPYPPSSAPSVSSVDTAVTADVEALQLQFPDTGVLVLSVADTGCGITMEQADRLFKPFSQGDSSIAHRFGGTGLGLALSRDLARLLGGDLVLRHSSVELGTVFEVNIPVRFLRADPTSVSICTGASPSPLSSGSSTTPVAATKQPEPQPQPQQQQSSSDEEPVSSSGSDDRPPSTTSSFSFPLAEPVKDTCNPVSVPAIRAASGAVLPDSRPAPCLAQKRVLSPAEQVSSSLQTIALSGVSSEANQYSVCAVSRSHSTVSSTQELASSPLSLPNVALQSSLGPAHLMGLYHASCDSFTTVGEQGTISNSSSLSNVTTTSPRNAAGETQPSSQRPQTHQRHPSHLETPSKPPTKLGAELWPPIDPSSALHRFTLSEIGSNADSTDVPFVGEGSGVPSDFASPSNPSTFSPASSIGSRDIDRSELFDSPLPAARPVSVLRPLKGSPLIANRASLRHWTRRSGQTGSPNPSAPATPELSSRAHASVSAVFNQNNQNSSQSSVLNHSSSSTSVTGSRTAANSSNTGTNSTVAAVGSLFGATDLSRKFPLRILVVDDHAISRRLLMKMLQTAGYTSDSVSAAEDGEQAVAIACAQNFDLILMDVQMPKMGGCEAASAIRDHYASLPSTPKPPDPPTVIALTAAAMKGDKERCLQSGMHDYLSKPIDWTLLFAKVIHWGSQRLDMH